MVLHRWIDPTQLQVVHASTNSLAEICSMCVYDAANTTRAVTCRKHGPKPACPHMLQPST